MKSLLSRGLLASLLLLHMATALPESNFDELPNLGDASGQIISPEQDRAMGASFMRQLRQAGIVLNDSETAGYVDALGRRSRWLYWHQYRPVDGRQV